MLCSSRAVSQSRENRPFKTTVLQQFPSYDLTFPVCISCDHHLIDLTQESLNHFKLRLSLLFNNDLPDRRHDRQCTDIPGFAELFTVCFRRSGFQKVADSPSDSFSGTGDKPVTTFSSDQEHPPGLDPVRVFSHMNSRMFPPDRVIRPYVAGEGG